MAHAGAATTERARLLEVLIGLSGATDLGMGLQAGESVRSAALAGGLARLLGLDDPQTREALYATLRMLRGKRFGRSATTATCEVGRRLAGRLGLPEGVQQALYESFEFWNGKGTPNGRQREEIAIGARLARVSATASLFAGIGDPSSPPRRFPSAPAACSTPACARC